MSQKLVQSQQLTQTQTLTPQQLMVVRLLELPVTELEERIQNELLENAALEESGDAEVSEENTEEVTAEASDNEYADATPETADALGDYLNSDDVPDYLLARADAEREQREIPFSGHTSFYERLHDQISEHDLTERETELMEYLIGSLDDDGLLRKDTESIVDELAIYHGLETTVEEVDRLVGILQTFDPRGIGARSLQECLHLQLADPDYHSPYKEEALTVVDKYFDEFIHKHWETICRRLGITEERFAHVKANRSSASMEPICPSSTSAALSATPLRSTTLTARTSAANSAMPTFMPGRRWRLPKVLSTP